MIQLIRNVSILVFETLRFGLATRRLALVAVVLLGLALLVVSLTAQVVAPLAVYPFA